MGDELVRTLEQSASPHADLAALAARLDRIDILLLKEFYHTGLPYPDDTISHVLRLLVDRLARSGGPLGNLSYGGIRYRLENMVALGLLGKITRTNPAIYYPLERMRAPVRGAVLLVTAEFAGFWKGDAGGTA